MKRFLTFLVILIAAVSLGLTIYYFSVDNEYIYIKSSYLIKNVGGIIEVRDNKNDLLDFRNRADSTTLTYSIQQDEGANVLSYNETEGYFTANKGGEAKIIVNTSNRSYARLMIDVRVCDGEEYPFMINNEDDLATLDSTKNYMLSNDIEITKNWIPIRNYKGILDGNHCKINNIKVTNNEITNGLNAGFISVLEGTVKNLKLTNVDINVDNAKNVGGIAGEIRNTGVIQTSEVTGTITNNSSSSTSSTLGGIAGKTDNADNKTRIDRCGFEGSLNATGSNITAGGIVGLNKCRITESYSRGKVDLGTYNNTVFGGIIGKNESGSNNIYDSYFYATEDIKNAKQAAGIIYEQNSKALVTGCYYGGKINALDKGIIAINTTEVAVSDAMGYLDDTINGFRNSGNFITTKGISNNGQRYDRPWNFNGVWTLSGDYPLLNTTSSVGSTYIIDPTDIVTDNTIDTISKLYSAVKANKGVDILVDIDASEGGFLWVPILKNDDGTEFNYSNALISSKGATISNLTIDARNIPTGSNIGLVGKAISGAYFSGIKFDHITILGSDGKVYKNVGVLAGESEGAKVSNLTIRTLEMSKVTGSIQNYSSFGSLFGYAGEGTIINKVDVHGIDASDGYYVYAGGLVGISGATITSSGNLTESGTTTTRRVYNLVDNVKLRANFAGGVAGTNAGAVAYTTVDGFDFNNGQNSTSSFTSKIYSTKTGVFVGGLTGTNEHTIEGTKKKGVVVDSYANRINIRVLSGKNYKMYLGGVSGFNSNDIQRTYVTKCEINVDGSLNAFAGGVTGYNNGRITKCFVDSTSYIKTSVIGSVATSVDKGNYMLNTDDCSIVGGLVGYDAQTTSNICSIYQSGTLMNTIKGYYAGGISGISFGKVMYSYCGDSKKTDGGVSITGFLAGGLSSVVAGGIMKNCYTVCRLNSDNGNYNYKNVLSVVKMEVSAVAGLTVFALNSGTVIESCYAVCTLNSRGVSYGSSADLTGFVCGEVRNCVYTQAGKVATRNGKQLNKSDLTGSNSYKNFKDNIGGNMADWSYSSNYLPTITGVNPNFPSSSLPKYN